MILTCPTFCCHIEPKRDCTRRRWLKKNIGFSFQHCPTCCYKLNLIQGGTNIDDVIEEGLWAIEHMSKVSLIDISVCHNWIY